MAQNKNLREKKPALVTFGDTGLERHRGDVLEEWHKDLAGTKARKIYREMSDNDPIVGSIKYAIEMLVRQTPFTINKQSDTPECERWAEFVESCIYDMESSFQIILAEILTAIDFGWSWLETTYKIRRGDNAEPRLNSQYNDGLIGWRDWPIRAQESLDHWEFDEDGSVIGMWQLPPTDWKLRFVPIDRSLHFMFRGSKHNPEGRSFFRSAYTSYYYRKRLQEIEAIGIERNVAGFPVVNGPPEIFHPNATADQKAIVTSLKDIAKKLRVDAYAGIAFPGPKMANGNESGYDVKLMASSGRTFAETDPIIRRHGSQLASAIALGEFISLGQDGVGSYSLHSDKTRMFASALGAIERMIEEVINRRAISSLMKLNAVPVDYWPEFAFGDIEKQSLVEFGQFISQMVGVGALEVSDDVNNMVRELVGLPPQEELNLLPAPLPDATVEAEESIQQPDGMLKAQKVLKRGRRKRGR